VELLNVMGYEEEEGNFLVLKKYNMEDLAKYRDLLGRYKNMY